MESLSFGCCLFLLRYDSSLIASWGFLYLKLVVVSSCMMDFSFVIIEDICSYGGCLFVL